MFECLGVWVGRARCPHRAVMLAHGTKGTEGTKATQAADVRSPKLKTPSIAPVSLGGYVRTVRKCLGVWVFGLKDLSVQICKCANSHRSAPVFSTSNGRAPNIGTGADRWIPTVCTFAHLHIK